MAKRVAKKKAVDRKTASPRRNAEGLTEKQQEFADLYRGDPECRGNAAACYRRMHPKAKSTTCETEGHRTLRNPKVSAYLERKQREAEQRADVSQADVLRELARLGFSRISGVFDEHGRLRRPDNLPPEVDAAVASVEVVTRPGAEVDADGNREVECVHKIRLLDKNPALDKLARHLGLYERDNQQKSDPISRLLEAVDGKTRGLPSERE